MNPKELRYYMYNVLSSMDVTSKLQHIKEYLRTNDESNPPASTDCDNYNEQHKHVKQRFKLCIWAGSTPESGRFNAPAGAAGSTIQIIFKLCL
jgi:hypothetical protein